MKQLNFNDVIKVNGVTFHQKIFNRAKYGKSGADIIAIAAVIDGRAKPAPVHVVQNELVVVDGKVYQVVPPTSGDNCSLVLMER